MSPSSSLRPSETANRNCRDSKRTYLAWATRQGPVDRKARTVCRKYRNFLRTYELSRSELTLQMWEAYKQPGRQAPAEARRRVPGRRKPLLSSRPLILPIPQVPDKRRIAELQNLGAIAGVQANPHSVVVAFGVAGRVVDQFVEPRGRKEAASYVASFKSCVYVRQLNPPEAIRDGWR